MPWDKTNLPDNVKSIIEKEDWTEKQVEAFIESANEALKEYDDEGKAISTGINVARKLSNAKQMPKVYYAKHIEKGVVNYHDQGMYYVDNEALNKMDKTFAGKPVYVSHNEVDLDNLQEKADGYVSESFYNSLDGWHWCKFIAVSDEAHEVINKGWSVSNAYYPIELGGSGVCHDIKYDKQIIDGEYEHLALVSNPRYENAIILTEEEYKDYNKKLVDKLQNSKSKEGVNFIMKFFKTKKEEIKESLENAIVEIDGKEVELSELISIHNAKEEEKKLAEEEKEKEKEKENKKMNAEDEVEIDGKMVKVKELINMYKENKKCNEEEEEKKEEKDFKEMEMKNAKLEKEMAEFKALENAKNKVEQQIPEEGIYVDTMANKLARGKECY